MENKIFIQPSIDEKNLTKALYNVNLELDKLNKLLQISKDKQKELFANLSHDFRSPITSIKNYAECILAFPEMEPSEMLEIVRSIKELTQTLEQYVNDILKLSLLDDYSENNFDFKVMDINNFLLEYFEKIKSNPKYSKFALKCSVPSELYYVKLDEKEIYRVLENLFDNAYKYSKDYYINLEAKKEGESIIISVEDKGQGIIKEDIEKVFKRTYKSAYSRTPNIENSCGLGLSIAESIVKNHGGDIWCESIFEEGSTFYFSLPNISI